MRIGIARNFLGTIIFILVIAGIALISLRLFAFAYAIPPINAFEAGYLKHTGLITLHIIPALLFIVLGPLQFIAKIRRNYPVFHRWSGILYILAACVVASSGFVLSVVDGVAGLTGAAANLFFSPLFLIFLGIAFYRIRRREVTSHREWMIRAFALGLAVVTTRPVFAILASLISNQRESEILGVAFWLAFSLHLLVAEIWVNITRGKVGS